MTDRKDEIPLSTLVPEDTEPTLNNMPDFGQIEEMVGLREAAQEKMEQLQAEGGKDAEDRILEIKFALAELEKSHHVADHHDSGKQCSERPLIRKGRIA